MMNSVAILGAGDLGASLARRLAVDDHARRVLLLDDDEGRARGKALDIQQCGPLEGFDVRVEGGSFAALATSAPFDAIVVADPASLAALRLPSEAAALLALALPALGPRGALVVAGMQPALVEMAVRKGLARERVVGSAPLAVAAGLRRRVATDLEGRPSDVALALLGRPPGDLVVPTGSVRLGGIEVDRLAPSTVRRALSAARGRVPGPFALAGAAVRVLAALDGADARVLPVFALLRGEYGQSGLVAAVPARLGRGRLIAVVEVDLAPVDRVAFDTAAGRD